MFSGSYTAITSGFAERIALAETAGSGKDISTQLLQDDRIAPPGN